MNALALEHCPVCNADSKKSLCIDTSEIWIAEGKLNYSLDVCNVCGGVYSRHRTLNPDLYTREFNVEAMMGNQQAELQPLDTVVWNFENKTRQVQELLHFTRKLQTINYLEFGASDGTLFRMLHQESKKPFYAHLVEPTGAAAPCAKITGVRVTSARITELSTTDKYNIIVSSHSLEHIENPRELLTQLGALLTDEGFLYIEVPDGERWDRSMAVPLGYYHIVNYTLSTLCWMLNDLGFDVEDARIIDNYPGIRVVAKPGKKSNDNHRAKESTALRQSIPKYMPAVGYSAINNWQHARSMAELLLKQRLEQLDPTKCLIWGAGSHTVSLLKILEKYPDIQIHICDRSPIVKKLDNYAVYNPCSVSMHNYDAVIISSYAFQSEIEVELIAKGFPQERIISLYQEIFSYRP